VIFNGRRAFLGTQTRKQPFVLTAGRLWDAAKNVRAVCAAAPGLRWPVEVAGPTQQAGTDGALQGPVRYLGHLDHAAVRTRMAAATIYALPARYEPFGLSVLEAALAGCVLVLGDIPSLREIWADCALFIPPDDAGALAAAINALAENPGRRILLAARARRRAAALTPERMGGAYGKLYEELVLRAADSSPRSKRRSADRIAGRADSPRMLTPLAPSSGGRGQDVPHLPVILDTSR
jgi:glycosyltransferase involved in cell wall biosynthesis